MKFALLKDGVVVQTWPFEPGVSFAEVSDDVEVGQSWPRGEPPVRDPNAPPDPRDETQT